MTCMVMAKDDVSLRLRQAITNNDVSLVQRILNNNPKLLYNAAPNNKANTSLHLAAFLGFSDIARYLIALGHDGRSQSTNEISNDPQLNHGISINTDGQTPLHMAASNAHTEVVQLLCESFPATINRPDNEGRTPLLLAAGAQAKSIKSTDPASLSKPTVRAAEDISAIGTLLGFGADVTMNDSRGDTCLHYACAFGNLKAIRALMQAGADPSAMNHGGWKPELYSLTVQAEVYYRNLVAEFGRRRAEEQRLFQDRQRKGGVRLVVQDDEEEDSDGSSSPTGRNRADSGRSEATFESAMS